MNRERGIYRGIYSALVDEQDYQALSPHARLTLLTCRVSAQAGPAAIFRYYPELLMVQTGLKAAQLERALVELEHGNWIYREGVVLWVRNGLRYDPYTTLANAKQRKGVTNWLEGLPKSALVLKFCDYYQLPYPFQVPSNGYRYKETETETEAETERTSTSPAEPDPPPTPAAEDWGKPEHLVSLYNQLAPPGHPRVTRLTPARRAAALKYLRNFPERAFWVRVFSEIKLSRLLTKGSVERPNFRGDFDWLLTVGKNGAENCIKTAEGKFRDKEHAA